MEHGRALQLFLVDGRPDGLVSAEIFGWTGHVLQVPRGRLKQALGRSESSHTGCYILLGEDENGPAYIGESDSLGKRLLQHAGQKDWWESAVLITTTANNLHKAHVKYLESRLVELSRAAKQKRLENGNTPPRPTLSEADRANMEAFLDMLQVVLPALRVDILINPKLAKTTPDAQDSDAALPRFALTNKKNAIDAKAVLDGSAMVVAEGSTARAEWVGAPQHNIGYQNLRTKLLQDGVLAKEAGHVRFTDGYAFSSPSAAAAVILGRAANGRTEWKHEDTGQTLKEWEEKQLSLMEEQP